MADYNLGSAHGEITIKYDGKGAQQAGKDIDTLEKSAGKADASTKKSAEAANKLASGMIIAGGAAVAGLTLAVRSATNFEDALAGVRAAGNASTDEMERLRQKALQLGADTKFSATEAAGAMEALIKAGLTTGDVLNGAADAAVNLAAAERIDLTQASEIAATAMTAFALKASDLPGIADTISRSASATKQTVTDFAQAMNQAGAVSKLVGLSFDDMALAITAMGKAGIVGSDAGTSLKTMLMNLQPQTKAQKKLFAELGLTTKEGGNQFFDAAGKIKPMVEIAGVLKGALKGMSEQQKLATLETLFGSDAIRAAAIVADQGADGMRNLSAEMGNQLSVSEKAKIQMSSFAGTLENFKGTMETAAIKVGSVLIPVLDKLVKMIGGLVDWFSKLPAPVQSALTWMLAIGGVSLVMIGSIVKIVTMLKSFIAILQAVKIAQISLLATMPWLLIAAAVAVAVLLIIMYWDEVLAFLTMVWTAIRDFAISIWNSIVEFFIGLWTSARDFWVGLWNEIQAWWFGLLMKIGEFFVSTWESIVEFFVNLWNSAKDFWTGLWNSIWGFITDMLGRIGNHFRNAWNSMVEALRGALQSVLNFFRNLGGDILNAVGDLGGLLWGAGRALINGLWEGIQSMFGWVWDQISNLGSHISNAFSAALSIFSPSKVFREFGVFTLEGYVLGLEDMRGTVLATVEDVAANVALVGQPEPIMATAALAAGTTGGDGASLAEAGATVLIENLHLSVTGNLDPTNPTKWRKAIVSIKDGIENVAKESR